MSLNYWIQPISDYSQYDSELISRNPGRGIACRNGKMTNVENSTLLLKDEAAS